MCQTVPFIVSFYSITSISSLIHFILNVALDESSLAIRLIRFSLTIISIQLCLDLIGLSLDLIGVSLGIAVSHLLSFHFSEGLVTDLFGDVFSAVLSLFT